MVHTANPVVGDDLDTVHESAGLLPLLSLQLTMNDSPVLAFGRLLVVGVLSCKSKTTGAEVAVCVTVTVTLCCVETPDTVQVAVYVVVCVGLTVAVPPETPVNWSMPVTEQLAELNGCERVRMDDCPEVIVDGLAVNVNGVGGPLGAKFTICFTLWDGDAGPYQLAQVKVKMCVPGTKGVGWHEPVRGKPTYEEVCWS